MDEESKVLYICDHRACEVCHDYCNRTADIAHAENFEMVGDIFVEKENKE